MSGLLALAYLAEEAFSRLRLPPVAVQPHGRVRAGLTIESG